MTFEESLKEQLKDPEFAREYNALAPEYEIIDQLIQARIKHKLTQKELAKRVGIKQSNISRLETGNYNPTLKFLKKLAYSLGKEIHLEFRDLPLYNTDNSK